MWLAWAVDDPAPPYNAGYGALNVPRELVDKTLRRGIVIHSVEGWFTYTSPSAVMAARGNSWAVTIMRDGTVWRHRPRPTFVNWHAGGPAQNIGTDGIEMEGKDQPWTQAQRVSLVRVLLETQEWFGWLDYAKGWQTNRTQEGIRQAITWRLHPWLGEHRWFTYTSCPSGRDDWDWLMPALAEGSEDTMLWFIKTANSGTVYVTDGIHKWGIPSATMMRELQSKKLVGGSIITVTPGLFSRLKTTHNSSAPTGGTVDPATLANAIMDKLAARLAS